MLESEHFCPLCTCLLLNTRPSGRNSPLSGRRRDSDFLLRRALIMLKVEGALDVSDSKYVPRVMYTCIHISMWNGERVAIYTEQRYWTVLVSHELATCSWRRLAPFLWHQVFLADLLMACCLAIQLIDIFLAQRCKQLTFNLVSLQFLLLPTLCRMFNLSHASATKCFELGLHFSLHSFCVGGFTSRLGLT